MALTKQQLTKLYVNMVRVRRLDELLLKALAEGKSEVFLHSGQGEEAVGVGACTFLREDDYIYPHHRGNGAAHVISKGVSPRAFLAEHYSKVTGTCRGLSVFHTSEPSVGIFGIGGTIGTNFSVSLGWGLAAKKRGKGQVVVSFFGDGGSNRGTLHESMNLAAVWKLPIIWVCSNNLYAMYMPIKDAYPKKNIADLAGGYGMPGVVVDGQDVVAVYEAVQAAVDRARAGQGPSLIECKTYRYRAHVEGMFDLVHADPRPQEEIDAWKKRDPIYLLKNRLLKQGILKQADIERIDAEIATEMEEAERFAIESPFPDPSILDEVLYANAKGGAK